MKVLAVTLRYPPYVGGGYELQAVDAVRGLRARGHRVDVLAGAGERHEADVLGWLRPGLDGEDPWGRALVASNAERFALHFFRPSNYAATKRALRRLEPDVCLFFNLGLLSLAPLLAARHAGVARLSYVADPWPTNHWLAAWRADPVRAGAKPGRLAALERAWSGFREAVELGPLLACSDWLRERLVEDGIPAEGIGVLHGALSPELEPPPGAGAPAPREAGEPLRVVCASSLWRGKGQDVLIEAAALARERGVELTVELAGGGVPEWRAALERRAAELGLGARVRFAGSLPRERLAALLARAHVACVPSTWGEPFGLVTIEAMAWGLAVVASDAGASPEVVTPGVDGLLFPAGDAEALAQRLALLAEDDGARRRLGAAGRETVRRRHGQAAFVDGLERALARAVGSAGEAGR